MDKNNQPEKINGERIASRELGIIIPEIDRLLCKGNVIVAIDGGSASGKTTLANRLAETYDCNVFHMDDFFLPLDMRTFERLKEIGGNIDRVRFQGEVLCPLEMGKTVYYRRFDCQTQTMEAETAFLHKSLTIVEGAYSMHPEFSKYYDLGVFLDIDPEYQKKRILIRNSTAMAERFFGEWIPMENTYFSETKIKEKCDLIINI